MLSHPTWIAHAWELTPSLRQRMQTPKFLCCSPWLTSSWFALGLCYFCQASLHKQLRALGCSACASWQAASQLGLQLGAPHPLRCTDHLEEKFVALSRHHIEVPGSWRLLLLG